MGPTLSETRVQRDGGEDGSPLITRLARRSTEAVEGPHH